MVSKLGWCPHFVSKIIGIIDGSQRVINSAVLALSAIESLRGPHWAWLYSEKCYTQSKELPYS